MRSKVSIRFLSLMLALLMLASGMTMLSACGDNGDGSEETTPNLDDSGEMNEYKKLEKTNYDRTLKVCSMEGNATEFTPNVEDKGETLTDLLFDRQIRLKSDFGITVTVKREEKYEDLTEVANKQASGRLDDFDLYVGMLHNFIGNALRNQCMDLNGVEYINLNAEWWDASCRDALCIDNKNFMMTGDISPIVMMSSSCMVFNKQLMQDLKKEMPYDLVYEGDWTLDRMYTYIEDVTNETTGQYGFSGWSLHAGYGLFYGCGETFVKFNDGVPEVKYDTAKVTDIYDKIYKLIITAQSDYVASNVEYTQRENKLHEVFTDGDALFFNTDLSGVSDVCTGMKDDYGVLPMPKYDKLQKEYMSFVNGGASLYYILNTEKDPDFVGHIMEALATYDYEYIAPKVVDVVCKSKDVRDPESADMVDYTLENRVYDLAYFTLMPLAEVVLDGLASESTSITTALNRAKSQSQNRLRSILKDWEDIKNMENKK